MDFSRVAIDSDTGAFWRELCRFLDTHLTEEVLEHEWQTGDRHSVPFHAALAERRWVVPTWPVEEGGAGLSSLHAALLEAELTRRRCPQVTRVESLISAIGVRAHGSDELRARVLPAIADGSIRCTLGWTEPDCGSDIAAARTRAEQRPDGRWMINGTKLYSTGAHLCTHSFLLTRTNSSLPKHQGLTMFLCPLDAPGVEIAGIRTLGGERTNIVYFDEVVIDDGWRVGPVDGGWAVLQAPLAADQGERKTSPVVLEDARYHSELGEALRAAVEWACSAHSGAGRPIDDPSVRARLARVEVDLEVAAVAPAGQYAKVTSSELLIRDAADLVDLVGPDAIPTRRQPGAAGDGAIEYAHRFSPGTAIYSGTNDIHRTIIAERRLGLPRSRPQ